MELYVWRGPIANFGDELNTWLLPKVFPYLFESNKGAELFLGIGSVLFNDHPADRIKVVFGSGYGGYTEKPVIDHNWKIYAVRGPRTALELGLPSSLVAADTAILLNKFRTKPPKTIKRAFMPHWDSSRRGHWRLASKLAGFHYLDPRAPVEQTLHDIESCELVVAEAMHGAIVADALRTPWIAIMPFERLHRFKWYDWAEAIGLSLEPHEIPPSSIHEQLIKKYDKEAWRAWGDYKWRKYPAKAWDIVRILQAAAGLRRVARANPTLSSDAELASAIGRLEKAAAAIERDYGQH